MTLEVMAVKVVEMMVEVEETLAQAAATVEKVDHVSQAALQS